MDADYQASYSFTCPMCERITVRHGVSRAVTRLLISAGVTFSPWRLPAELFEQHDGEPINHDDVLHLHQQLQGEYELDELTH